MAKLSSPYAAQNANAAGGGSAEFDGPVVYRLQHDPIVDKEAGFNFPDGLFAVMVDGEIIEATPLPVTDDRKHPIKSIITRSFTPVPNCPFNKPPGDDMAPLQIQRNMVETLTTLILMHDATPRTYIPLSVTLETEPTGMPGEPVYYRSTIPGERPQTDRGINPPEALYRHLEMIDEKFDEMSHLNAVLQGERPAGDPTLGEVQMLQERGMSAFRAPLSALVQFEKHLSRLLLWVAKDTAWAPRFRQVMGENSEWEIRQFSASDLGGEVDVMVEASSAWPKSLLMQQLRIKDAFAMGVFPPPAQDPELATKLTILMDLTDLKPSVDVDRKQITRELDRWKAARFPQEITPPDELMNLGLHLFLKGQFIKTEEAELLAEKNAPVYQAMRQHIMQLKQLLAPPPPPMPPPGKPGPEKTAREQGDNSAIDNAVQAGVLVPEAPAAPPQAPGAALGQMVDQGALVPEAVSTATGQPGVSIDDLITARALQPIDGNAVPVSSGPPPAAPPAMPGPMGPMPRRPGGPPQVQ
jgi:hypothetical protein